jgi:hypothetical protein
MPPKRLTPALVALIALAGASQARCQAPPQTAEQSPQTPPAAPLAPPMAGAPASSVTPPAPAFKAGDPVADRTGAVVGDIQALVESPAGPMVVVRIDGKMVSLTQSTLKMDGERIVSSQTKDQMLAAAGAPG